VASRTNRTPHKTSRKIRAALSAARSRGGRKCFVTRFAIAAGVFAKYKVETVGGAIYKELWVPAEELPAFNQSIIGKIEVVAEFR
jgi:hypothetical protein